MKDTQDLGFQLLDYINNNSSKKIRNTFFIMGNILGLLAKDLSFDVEPMKYGITVGIFIGLAWTALRYNKMGTSGVLKTQKEISVAIIYLGYLVFGAITGFFVLQKAVVYFSSYFSKSF